MQALFHLAEICTENGDWCNAIVNYLMLLEIKTLNQIITSTLTSSKLLENINNYLGKTHLNLSKIYQNIHQYNVARIHGEKALMMSESTDNHADCLLNVALVSDKSKLYHRAIEQLKTYLQHVKRQGDVFCISTAYGHMGRVYARLMCPGLSKAYFDQQIRLVEKCKNKSLVQDVCENAGDSSMFLNNHDDAVAYYEHSPENYGNRVS